MSMQTENEELVNNIQVLYEDDDILVVNKPSGIMVHGDGRSTDKTVVDWFLSRAPSARGVGEPGNAQDGTPLERSGVVHRLDRETSGVLVLAKTQDAFLFLKEQFHDRHIKKEYHACVYGVMRDKWGSIERPIGRSPRDFRLRSAERGARGLLREASTDWEVIDQSTTHAYLKILPKTGRTHQIRVHLKSISRPIIQDSLYAPADFLKKDALGFERLALHAYKITLATPKGVIKSFTAELPSDFEKAIQAIAAA